MTGHGAGYMLILNINGPINSGKSTVSKLLVTMLEHAVFIEVDNLMSNAERRILGLTVEGGWTEKLNRLDIKMDHLKTSHIYETVIFAYPITERYYERWQLWDDGHNDRFVNVTLAPPMEVCLSDRGSGRKLSEWEINRVKEMYEKGMDSPSFSDLIIDNGDETPEETAAKIRDFIKSGCKKRKR